MLNKFYIIINSVKENYNQKNLNLKNIYKKTKNNFIIGLGNFS